MEKHSTKIHHSKTRHTKIHLTNEEKERAHNLLLSMLESRFHYSGLVRYNGSKHHKFDVERFKPITVVAKEVVGIKFDWDCVRNTSTTLFVREQKRSLTVVVQCSEKYISNVSRLKKHHEWKKMED